MKKNPTTLSDIAKRMNVSVATVSRALHDHPAINPDTKKRAVLLAQELNYQPNLLAVNLLSRKTKTIGVIVPEFTSYFFSSVINGIQDFINDAGYNLLISQTEESFKKEQHVLEAMAKVRVDGFLISPTSETNDPKFLNNLIDSGIPVVVFDRDCNGFKGDKVFVDDYAGAFQAVEYLIKSGCRQIIHITGPSDLSISQHRLNGYLDALRKNHILTREELIIKVEGFTPEYGVEAAKKIIESHPLPDGIFAINDGVAIGAMYVIKEAGIKIPGQISVIGFDDEPHSSYFIPPLSSVWQPVYDMGMLSARILLEKVKGERQMDDSRYELLKPELMTRASSMRIVI